MISLRDYQIMFGFDSEPCYPSKEQTEKLNKLKEQDKLPADMFWDNKAQLYFKVRTPELTVEEQLQYYIARQSNDIHFLKGLAVFGIVIGVIVTILALIGGIAMQ